MRRHRLGEEFCRLLPHLAPARAETLARTHAAGTKAPYEPPLFFLATPEEYRVIREIMAATENPYLAWAQSPEEILLSRPLYAKHPQLSTEILAGHHFAALFLLSFEEGG